MDGLKIESLFKSNSLYGVTLARNDASSLVKIIGQDIHCMVLCSGINDAELRAIDIVVSMPKEKKSYATYVTEIGKESLGQYKQALTKIVESAFTGQFVIENEKTLFGSKYHLRFNDPQLQLYSGSTAKEYVDILSRSL